MTEETLIHKKIFFERDLSWLSFNARVLQEAADPDVPLYERIRFLAIFSNNLDEFFRVRITALKQFRNLKKDTRKLLDENPRKVLKKIRQTVQEQQQEFGRIFRTQIIPGLRRNGVDLLTNGKFTGQDTEFARSFFEHSLKETLDIRYCTESGPQCFLENHALYFAVSLENRPGHFAIVNIPVTSFGRFIDLPSEGKTRRICFIDDVVRSMLPGMIPGFVEAYAIKLSRDAELHIDDEFDGDLLEKIKKGLKDRSGGLPTRFLYDPTMPGEFVRMLMNHFGIRRSDTVKGGRYHNFNDFFSFPFPDHGEALEYVPMPPLPIDRLDRVDSLLDEVHRRDLLFHFPYQRFTYVTRLMEEAVNDGEVSKIRMTLYRVAAQSALLNSLLRALGNGKEVTVFIEVKARFDEETNIKWGDQLKAAGATVLYSYPGIKVHSKMFLIEYDAGSGKLPVAYLGTGNFNERTARVYCDHALITANPHITRDVAQVFHVLERKIIVPKPRKLLVAPFNLRKEFHSLIDREIEHAREGRQASMLIKMNSLEDRRIIRKLYEASQAGVRVRMIVRGICCLMPGLRGLSENIEIRSIIDRFLEHARLYLFANGGEEELYMGSADWMTRNLDRRIETITPILDKRVFSELRKGLEIQWADNTKARVIDAGQTNPYVQAAEGEPRRRAQYDFYAFLEKKSVRKGLKRI